jgi:hypothetical protein
MNLLHLDASKVVYIVLSKKFTLKFICAVYSGKLYLHDADRNILLLILKSIFLSLKSGTKNRVTSASSFASV